MANDIEVPDWSIRKPEKKEDKPELVNGELPEPIIIRDESELVDKVPVGRRFCFAKDPRIVIYILEYIEEVNGKQEGFFSKSDYI